MRALSRRRSQRERARIPLRPGGRVLFQDTAEMRDVEKWFLCHGAAFSTAGQFPQYAFIKQDED